MAGLLNECCGKVNQNAMRGESLFGSLENPPLGEVECGVLNGSCLRVHAIPLAKGLHWGRVRLPFSREDLEILVAFFFIRLNMKR